MMKTVIENLKCNGYINTFLKSITKITRIAKVEIQFASALVLIKHNKKIINRDDIIQTLQKLGYPEKSNNSLIKDMKSYVSCAIGRMK